jgi:hypothetical protein
MELKKTGIIIVHFDTYVMYVHISIVRIIFCNITELCQREWNQPVVAQ